MYEERADCPFSVIYGHVLFFGTAEKFKKLPSFGVIRDSEMIRDKIRNLILSGNNVNIAIA